MVAGVFFTVGFKLYTPYMDHWTIKSIVENVTLDQDEIKKPIPEIKRDLDRRFGINQVRLPERDSLKIKLEEGVLHFDLDYETRVPMFYNVDAVVVFKEHYEVTKP
ncbi:DUF4845 domain-containing protein [Marinobacterium sp. D7]|nr:DUF4845 domain-containing protein [Marinobacterium ramblicola]MBV1786900.1 DUF4845 domain-containing protein [Marinobacterium ramblicola]